MFQFSKYHGCGNHFIITEEEQVQGRDLSRLAVEVCNPYIGINADGFIIVKKEPLRMLFYNRDGSMAPMCGNGIRCFAHYCRDEEICTDSSFPVDTGAGKMHIQITRQIPFTVRVNMGRPDFSPAVCGIRCEEPFFDRELEGLHRELKGRKISTFFMGTIHTVLWTDDFEGWEILGEKICHHPAFPEKTNVNFARIAGEDTVEVRTYERGVGPTLACGTGACAVAVLGWLQGKFREEVTVLLPYGQLSVSREEREEDGDIFMEGPSTRVFTGNYTDERGQKE